jgi:IS5 family transposase
MGKREEKQQPLWVGASELPRSAGHRFYEKLNELLREANFDRKVEALCRPFYEDDGTAGRRSIPPGVYFRMLFVGYFEGIESERGLAWRCSDSLSLRDFLGLLPHESVPDHSSLSRIRTRLAGSVYDEVFRLVLRIVETKGLLRGKVAGVDSTYLRADASMKTIVRKDTEQSYQEYLKKLCQEQGIENPTVDDCRRIDRKRKGKRTSNKDWKSKTDGDARIARLKDGRTRLAYKAEHVVDMDTGAVLAAEIHHATEGDTVTLPANLDRARENVDAAKQTETDAKRKDSDDDEPRGPASPARTLEVVADKGYHKVETLQGLKGKRYRTYISVPKQTGTRHWRDKGGYYTARTFYANRDRVTSPKGKALLRRRGELLERSFAHACETGGHRRVRLRGRENVRKRYVLQVAAVNLGLVMRALFGRGTPRQEAEARKGRLVFNLLLWAALDAVVRFAAHAASALYLAARRAMGSSNVQPCAVGA